MTPSHSISLRIHTAISRRIRYSINIIYIVFANMIVYCLLLFFYCIPPSRNEDFTCVSTLTLKVESL